MIPFIKKILSGRKKILVVFFLIVFIQLGLFTFLYQRADRITPPGHTHILADEHSYYAAVIRQSMLGAWAHIYPYTTTWTPKIYTYLFYIGAGKIAGIFHIDPIIMYEVTRVTGAVAVFITTYWLITLLFPASLQIPAMIFTMMFETGPMWTDIFKTPIWQWTTSYFIQPLLGRQFYLAHHLWGEALGLALLCMMFRAIQQPSRLALVLILMLSVAAPLTNPTFSAILVPCVFAPWLLYATATKTLKRTFLPIVIATAGVGFVGLFTLSQFSLGPPWNTVTSTEKAWWTTSTILIPFFESYSLFFPFIALLFILVPFGWKKWSPAMRRTFVLAVCWTILPAGLIYLSAISWVPFINGRVATDLSMVPVGILSTLVFYAAVKTPWFRRYLRHIVIVVFFLITGVSLFLSVVYFNQMIQYQNDEVSNRGDSWVTYPTVNLWNGVMALKKVPLWSHIMAYPMVADILPVYLPVRVWQGETSEGTDFFYRRGQAYLFYTGKMSREDLLKLFTDNAISYVFYGPEESIVTKTPTFYPDFLEPIYTNPEVIIYKVRPLK